MEIITTSKLNLNLKVLRKRNDGYHEIKSVMTRIDIGDKLILEKSNEDLFTTNMIEKENNLVVKALLALRKVVNVPPTKIHLEKKTPIGSGMGSGSGDAAYTLMGLNELYNLNLDKDFLKKVATNIGMDVSFFLGGPLSLATGRGEILEPLMGVKKHTLVVMEEEVISKNIYSFLEKEDFGGDCYNSLLKVALRLNPKLKDFYLHLMEIDHNFRMTGAGGAFFLIGNKEKLEKTKNKVEAKFKEIREILVPGVNDGKIIFNT